MREDKLSPSEVQPIQHVCIAGNIAAGKSTLSKQLSELLDFRLCEEPASKNPYLESFYQDKAEFSFVCQVHFLSDRFQQHFDVMKDLTPEDGVVTDRSPFEDVLFASMLAKDGLMTPLNFETYMKLFRTLVAGVGTKIPQVILLLDVSLDELMRRLVARQRQCEQNGAVTREYLDQLSQQYEQFVTDMSKKTCVVRVPWDTFRPIEKVWEEVGKVYDGTPGVKTIEWET